jgi:outer membrane lipoprotein-sorting protein
MLLPRRMVAFYAGILCLALGAVVCGPALAAPADPSFPIAELMRMLAAVPQSHATFQEVRTVAQLTTPVRDSGTLDYVRPGRLDKHTLAPRDERLVVDGERLWIERAGQQTRMLDLADQPEVSALVDTVRGTLSGDLPRLRKSYDVTLSGSAASWRLVLVPTDTRVQRFLRAVHIEGTGRELTLVETIQTDGNSSRMQITPG